MTNEMKIKKALESIKGDYSLKNRALVMRKLFKDLYGYNNKKLSIKCSRGSAIYVTILDSEIIQKEIESIAKKFSMIDYDEYSGEILAGGNIFVFVDYDTSLKNNFYNQLRNISEMMEESVEREGSSFKTDSGLKIFYNSQYKHLVVFNEEDTELFSTPTYNLTGALVGIVLLEKVITLKDILSLKKV